MSHASHALLPMAALGFENSWGLRRTRPPFFFPPALPHRPMSHRDIRFTTLGTWDALFGVRSSTRLYMSNLDLTCCSDMADLKGMFNTRKQDWRTPLDLFNKLDEI